MNLQLIVSEQADTLGWRIWKINATPYPRWSAVRIKQAEPFKVDDCGNLPRGVWRWTLRGSVRKGAEVGLTSGVGDTFATMDQGPPHAIKKCNGLIPMRPWQQGFSQQLNKRNNIWYWQHALQLSFYPLIFSICAMQYYRVNIERWVLSSKNKQLDK